MGLVGQAPWSDMKRRTIRSEVNPMDKSTVVSIYPVAIHETKPTIQPGTFDITAGSYEKPAILVVGPSSWWREIDEDQPLLEIPNSSIQIADSIVKDYCNGIIECNMNEIMPGLFYVPGEKTVDQICKDHKKELDRSNEKQKRWYSALVQVADTLWSRSNGNPLSISNDMRIAALQLNLTKDWMADFTNIEMVRCKACGNLNNSTVVVCPNCKVVLDTEKFKTLGLTFAQ